MRLSGWLCLRSGNWILSCWRCWKEQWSGIPVSFTWKITESYRFFGISRVKRLHLAYSVEQSSWGFFGGSIGTSENSCGFDAILLLLIYYFILNYHLNIDLSISSIFRIFWNDVIFGHSLVFMHVVLQYSKFYYHTKFQANISNRWWVLEAIPSKRTIVQAERWSISCVMSSKFFLCHNLWVP